MVPRMILDTFSPELPRRTKGCYLVRGLRNTRRVRTVWHVFRCGRHGVNDTAVASIVFESSAVQECQWGKGLSSIMRNPTVSFYRTHRRL